MEDRSQLFYYNHTYEMKNKAHWISKGSSIFYRAVFRFCIAFIFEIESSMRISKHGLQSIAPENLKRPQNPFGLSSKLSHLTFQLMRWLNQWRKGLQIRVDAYADRLETTREENRRRMMVTSILYLCSAIGMAVFSVLNSKRLKAELAGK